MFWIWQTLIITARMVGGSTYSEAIEEINGELTKVIEEFEHAVDVETLRFAKKSGKHALSQSGDSAVSVTSCRPKRARARGAWSFGSTA